ncbi:MAG: hypothetical protein Ct9H300mP18_09580 [Candidatus Neomarinimicrobiota bacterium]|nr:MAG: hypothetical protein Ct9H300mP18_09580 [Candidatus Neomarinimicrobiota bacterium]
MIISPKTFFSQFVTPLLLVVTILEVFGGIVCFIGWGKFFKFNNNSQLIKVGLFIIALDLIALFFGQRFEKGLCWRGPVLVNFFILKIIGLLTFAI